MMRAVIIIGALVAWFWLGAAYGAFIVGSVVAEHAGVLP